MMSQCDVTIHERSQEVFVSSVKGYHYRYVGCEHKMQSRTAVRGCLNVGVTIIIMLVCPVAILAA